MLRGTYVDVFWHAGIELKALLEGVAGFSARHGLALMPLGGKKPGYLPPHGLRPYRITFREADVSSVETDDVIAARPFHNPRFNGVYWELYDVVGKEWFWLSIRKESLVGGRVGRLFIAFYEGYFSLMSEEDVPNAIAKYHQLKELFRLLEADVLSGRCSSAGGERFRFAKQGRQILIGPMEELRRPRPEEEQEGTFKIVVDPPPGSTIA
jgi:hypothetical protein